MPPVACARLLRVAERGKPARGASVNRRAKRCRRATLLGIAMVLGIALSLGACGSSATHKAASTTSVPPTAVRSTATTTTSRQMASISKIDFRNYTYEDRVCGTHKLVRFTNGEWRQDPTSQFNTCGMGITAVSFADVTGDDSADAIVTGFGSAGRTALGLVTWTTVFTQSASGPVNHGYLDGQAFPPYSTSGGITVWSQRLQPNDPACCPSSYQKTTYKYESAGRFTQTATALVPASQFPTSSATTVPTTTTSTTTPPPGSPPCTAAAIQPALRPDERLVTPRCVGTWAIAGVINTLGDEYNELLKWNGSAWAIDANRTADCTTQLPNPIYPLCNMN
jgi:hypothetical protein